MVVIEQLTEQRIIELMQDEWKDRVRRLEEQLSKFLGAPIAEALDPSVRPGLRVRHNGSGIEYEVSEISPNEVVLLTPEKRAFCVSDAEFEDEYGGPGDREPVKKKPKKEKG